MNRRALSLTEIIIALSIAVVVMIPVTSIFSNSGQQMTKTANLGFASSMARRIAQHIMICKFDQIVDVPSTPIQEAPDDSFFNPVLNFEDTRSGIQKVADIAPLKNFLIKSDFKYEISVVDPNDYQIPDKIKDVSIYITWKENNRDMMYRTNIHVPYF